MITDNEHQSYSGPERRVFARSVSEVEEAFDRKLRDHEQRESERLKTLIKQLEKDAFPDGAAAHRLAHQAMIDAAVAEKEFWNGLKADIAKKSIWPASVRGSVSFRGSKVSCISCANSLRVR